MSVGVVRLLLRSSGMDKTTKTVRRRDGSGHLDSAYAAKLRMLSAMGERDTDPVGFVAESISTDSFAEESGESFVRSATSGASDDAETRDSVVVEEMGGPFVLTTSGNEFARGTDESNPDDAGREPFPTT